jgi:hypothetical protein
MLCWNACSVLYGAAAREAKRRSFQKIITYVFASDVDTSLIIRNSAVATKNIVRIDSVDFFAEPPGMRTIALPLLSTLLGLFQSRAQFLLDRLFLAVNSIGQCNI